MLHMPINSGESMPMVKCMSCGASLDGPAFYCDGCGNYLCRNCGVPAEDEKYNCPNCTGELSQVSF